LALGNQDRITGRGGACLGLLMAAALLVRLGAAVGWQSRLADPHAFFFPDSQSYWHLGRAIAYGEPYQFGSPDARVFRTPGYPMVLAPVFWLGGRDVPVLWGRVWGAILGVIPVGCCWWLGRRLFGPRAGWLAGLGAALYPEVVAACVFILSEAAFCPLMGIQLVLLVLAWQSRHFRHALGYALAAGLAGGAATLVRPSWLWFTPVVALGAILACAKKGGRKESPGPALPDKPTAEQPLPPKILGSVSTPAWPLQRAEQPLTQKTPVPGSITAWATQSAEQPGSQRPPAPGSSMTSDNPMVAPRLPEPNRLGPTVGLAMAGLMLAGMILVLLPWWIRNYRLIGRFVPTTLQVGASLYDGLHPGATGKSQMEFVEEFARSERWLLAYRGPEVQILDPARWQTGRKKPEPAGPTATASEGQHVPPPQISHLPAPTGQPFSPPTGQNLPTAADQNLSMPSGQNLPTVPDAPMEPASGDQNFLASKVADFPSSTGQNLPLSASAESGPSHRLVLWEYWLDRALAEEALAWAYRHPDQVLRLALRKLWRMWTPWPNEPTLAASPLAALVGGTYLPILLAGLFGLVQRAREDRAVWLLALPALYLSLVHSVFVSSLRYRGPAMFGWIVLGAGWAAEKLGFLHRKPNDSE